MCLPKIYYFKSLVIMMSVEALQDVVTTELSGPEYPVLTVDVNCLLLFQTMSIFHTGGSRKPAKNTSDVLNSTETVNLYHPGYSSLKLMLILVAYAAPSGDPFSVVLDACCILTNNRNGTLRVVGAKDDLIAPDDETCLLPPGYYTYRVTGGEVYAVHVVESTTYSDGFIDAIRFVHHSAHGPRPTSCPHIGTAPQWEPKPLTSLRRPQTIAQWSRSPTAGVQ
jgi:hypothetical protein